MKRQSKGIQRKTGKKRRAAHPAKNNFVAPRTLDEFFAMPERLQDRWVRATHAVSKMRADRVSLPQAAREFRIDPRTVIRLSGSALRKGNNGRYVARATDRLLRVLEVLSEAGRREVGVRDSRQATLVAEHWNAVHRYLETGVQTALQKFRGKHIVDADRQRLTLLTDTAEIDRFGSAGVLSFESMYARTA